MKTLHVIHIDKNLPGDIFVKIISIEFNLTRLSIGNLIVEQIHKWTELGADLEKELASGNLLQIETIEKILKDELINNNHNGILLYSYPRTQAQLNSLKQLLLKYNFSIERIWYFKTPKNAATKGLEISEIPETEMTIIEINEPDEITEDKIKKIIKSYT